MTSVEAAPSPRVVAWDVLRGAALFGVLVVNVVAEFRVSAFEAFVPTHAPGGAADRIASALVSSALGAKPFIVLSFLFGMGLAAQTERARQTGAPTVARRLGFLFVVGATHFVLLWDGDVLALYAVVAMLAAALVRLRTRTLVVLGVILCIIQALPLPYPRPFPSREAMLEHVEAAGSVYRYGSYATAVAFRLTEVRPALALLLWSVPRTAGLFLFGAAAWREGFADRALRARPLLFVSVGAMLGGALATWCGRAAVGSGALGSAAITAADLLLAAGYGAALLAGLSLPIVGAGLRLLAPIGRMTLTSYLVESFVLGLVFYGHGLGLFARVGAGAATAGAIALFGAQAVFASWWLGRFRFGPIEWAWRSVSYGHRLRLRR